jgi:threonine dehydrogenase-like Zn-dependent dehydrogenase
MDVTSLAGTVLKDLGTSQDIADWIVAHEAAWIDEQKMPALKESHTVVIGGGNIGAALAKGLVDLGAERITIVDPEVEAVRARLRSMGLGDKGIAVQAREGSEPLPVAPYYFSAVGRRSIVDAGTLRAMPDGAVVMNCASRGEVDETFIVQASAGTSPDVLEAHERESGLLREHTTLTTTLRAADGGKGPTVHLRRMGQPAFDGIQDKNVPCIDVTFAGALAALAEVLERLSKPGGWVPQLLYLCAVRQAQVFEAARASGYDLDVDAALEALKANDGRSR